MPDAKVVALSGGIGGAKLALGLSRVVAPENLALVANTGDDFEHLGLTICPDIDTLVYTLSDIADPERGWGRRDETWNFMAALRSLGGETWFNLGDGDLALHVERSRRLAAGETLSQVTAAIAARLGIGPAILPASDDPVRTVVETPDGALAFQDYFVRRQAEPVITGLRFEGAPEAQPAQEALAALSAPDLRAIVVCPSNPLISIGPILAVPGIREAIARNAAPVIAVSPIVAGQALKGPTAKMMRELGMAATAGGVAQHYQGLIDGLVIDTADEELAAALAGSGIAVHVAPTVMRTVADKEALATSVLAFADAMAASR